MSIRLPFLGEKTYQTYAFNEQRIKEARGFAADPLATPDEAAAIHRYADRVEVGLRKQRTADAVQSINLCALQATGTAVLPALLMGSSLGLYCAGGVFLGLAVHLTTQFLGSNLIQKSIMSGPQAMQDALVYSQHKTLMEERLKQRAAMSAQVQQKIDKFEETLKKVARPPENPPVVEHEPEAVKIAGIRVPVRREASQPPA